MTQPLPRQAIKQRPHGSWAALLAGVLLGSLQATWALGVEAWLTQACALNPTMSRQHSRCPLVLTLASSERTP